ncbi:monooxygenase [Fusarium globosum]|uniref:Monooxygenase n=1 Tax=Fusarium globosum TaxID=78864 RepID=A0A8H5YN65_9HYPO|nr:monooxygenase [Fusarium globosum]
MAELEHLRNGDAVDGGQVNCKDSVLNGSLVQREESQPKSDMSTSEYSIRETPMGTRRKLKIIFMGMGCSGIDFAQQLERRMQDVTLVIYGTVIPPFLYLSYTVLAAADHGPVGNSNLEKNSDLGGTWLENRYPGCACDIPSVCYQYSWARKPDWSQYYSGSPEIHQYFKDVAEKADVVKYCHFNHKIIRAEWLQTGRWKITVMRNNNPDDTFEDHADFFLHGGGVLNNWRWPNIKGLHSFQGPTLHTARWDHKVELKGKRVLQIGIGSSGVQVIPAIINDVDQLYVVARSSVWITAGFAPTYAGPQGTNFHYSDETKDKFRSDEDFYLSYCKAIESELNVRFKFLIKGSKDAIDSREYSIQEMRRKLAAKPELMNKIIPSDFGVGCRRPTPGSGFLEALCLEKTTVLTQEIQGITPTGFIDAEGVAHEVDVVICATGFDTSFRPTFPVMVEGKNVQDAFNDDTIGYLGLSTPNVPNYFIYIGPYGPLGHGSVVPMVEAYTNYIIQVLEKVQVEDIKSVRVKQSVAESFTRHADLYLKRTAWSDPCSSWFKNGQKGMKPLCWPGSRVHYLTMLQKPRFEDFDIDYLSGNPFNFLGNGFDTREFDGRDLTWYYGLLNGQDKQPKTAPAPVF